MQTLYCSRRRRRGTTSPPLIGIERKPGPRRRPKRKSAKQNYNPLSTPKRAKIPSIHSSPEDRNELKELLESGRSQESIGRFSKKMVARWAKRLKETGEVALKSFHPEVKADLIHEVEVPDRSGHKQLSDIEKGEIKAYYYVGLNYTRIAKRVGRAS